MTKTQQAIFYSWQSDSPPKTNRNFIQTALNNAVETIKKKDSIAIEPVVDSDTRNVAGSPKIADTIFAKIDASAIFVGDVTIIGSTRGRTAKERKALPNPNVLVELGYALKALEDKRLILVINTAFAPIEDLPFDLLGRRILPYTLKEKDLEQTAEGRKTRKDVREKLQKALEIALESIFNLPPRNLNDLPAPLLILQGAKSLRDKAATTIGPRGGRTLVFGIRDREKFSTRDGLTITSYLTSQDHLTRQGVELLARTAEEIRKQAGDGAKTALLMCYELVNSGYKAVETGELLSDVLYGMERAVEKTVADVRKQKKVLNPEEIANVARTAGGTNAAKLLIEAFEKAKSEGIWMVEEENSTSSSVEIQKGVSFNRGYLTDEFANDPESGNSILNNCFVLAYDGKIYSSAQIVPVLEQIVKTKKSVFILAEDIEGEALHLLVSNNNKNIISCVAVKAPGYNENKKEWLKDIATITGSELLGGFFGKPLENADLSDLGNAEKIVVDKDKTLITPGHVNQERIATRLAQLRKQIEQTTSSHDRDKLHNRLANLIGSTAVIKIGGTTREQLLDSKYKVTTAMFSVRQAISHGYVLGGGLTYYNAQRLLNKDLKLKSLNNSEKVGIRAVQRALLEPIMCLLRTGKESIEELHNHSNGNDEIGFNLITKKYENLRDGGVWESPVVAAFALQIAFSHAQMILETTSWDTIQPDPPYL